VAKFADDIANQIQKFYLPTLLSPILRDSSRGAIRCLRVASYPDEVNCNVYETLAFNDVSRHENLFEENIRGSLKSMRVIYFTLHI